MSTQQPLQAPDFTLDHVLGHSVTLSQYRGMNAAVLFANRDTAPQIKQAIPTIRRTFGEDRVAIITILDMRTAPRPARVMVRGKLKKGYEEQMADVATLGLGGGIHMLVDWDGKVVDSYGVVIGDQAVAAAIDAHGHLLGWGAGQQLGDQIVAIFSAIH